MNEIIQQRVGEEEGCAYLPAQRARMAYRIIHGCRLATYQQLLEHGWRRFGHVFFRPICQACSACRSLRVTVASFVPNRSMRRTARRNRDLRVVLRRPTLSRDHLDLYDRYHADMAARKGWREKTIAADDYYHTFVAGHRSFGHEMLFLDAERLVAVALVDILPAAVSAVYCYYDPALRRRALGVYSVLQHIALARARGIPHVYLGYWIEGHPSMSYKARYGPHQLIAGRPALDEAAVWAAPGDAAEDTEVSAGTQLVLPPALRQEIATLAAAAYPEEACGLLIGSRSAEVVTVQAVGAAQNIHPADRRRCFLLDPAAFVDADRRARARGLDVVGFWHSHPDTPSRPSAADLEAAWEGYAYLIVSTTPQGATMMRAWHLASPPLDGAPTGTAVRNFREVLIREDPICEDHAT